MRSFGAAGLVLSARSSWIPIVHVAALSAVDWSGSQSFRSMASWSEQSFLIASSAFVRALFTALAVFSSLILQLWGERPDSLQTNRVTAPSVFVLQFSSALRHF